MREYDLFTTLGYSEKDKRLKNIQRSNSFEIVTSGIIYYFTLEEQ